MTPGLPYFIENYRDRPLTEGSWQCDAGKLEIRYRPANNEAFSAEEAVVPRLTKLISIEGSKTQSVHDLHFEDLYFSTTAWRLPNDGWAAMQAEVGLPGAIEMQNANAIKFRRFALVHTGATGIRIRENCFDVEISQGELRDLGGTGIAIGSEQRRPAPGTPWNEGESSLSPTRDVRVSDNLIASVGRIHFAAVGVWIGQADHILVERNEIRDLYYTGISVGWTWEYGPSLSHDNRIVGNVVSDFGQGVLSDLGGIYTLGRQANSLVEGNFILGGKARKYGGHGLYADAGTAGFSFRNNVVMSVSHAGIHIHYGTDLLFERNYLLDYGEAGVRCTRPSKGSSVVFKNNSLESDRAPPFFGVCTDRSYVFADNEIISGKATQSSSGLPTKIQQAVEEIRSRAGRTSPTRFTENMQDAPSIVP
ncbi:right-handed parallel beta-helix repeat-containing protein [Bradyrhizobium sp. 195]|uniref:right-handed parallel beta-helix repeat-containing protein n=1 Tax=Bradyrhizobium sp. 195 TaxID=2782662 RepID=UPI00200191EC|nr:right-handed parallel beta-helix repeat-containing protein [Bradyrhizobium sp. 195]UPK25707.1 right-handed parallel beta-helix repeat-containing protein [Bradyrhizobium sp. 195]